MSKSPKANDVDADLVRKLAGLLDETGLSEIEYGSDDWTIRVAKGATTVAAAVPAPAAAPAAPVADAPATGSDQATDYTNHPGVVTSPMVGVVYTASDPESPVFIKEGDRVSEGQTLLLVEAMKVFNPITAPRAGTVSKILITNGNPVEFGEPLLIIE